jgi:hypothetical protein
MAKATRRMGVREMLEFTSELFSTSRDWLETTFHSPAIHGLLVQWAESKSEARASRHYRLGPSAIASSFVIVSEESCSAAASRLSPRWGIEEVPRISRMFRAR